MKLNPLGQHMHEPTDLAHIWDLPRGKKTISIWLADKEWPKNTPLRWPLKFEKLNDVRSLKFGPIELRRVSVKRNTNRHSIQNIFSY